MTVSVAGMLLLADQLEHLELAAEIERGRRLVQQQDRRQLRQRSSDDDPLTLTAGQVPEGSISERQQVKLFEHVGDDAAIVAVLAAEVADIRGSAEHHVVGDAQTAR